MSMEVAAGEELQPAKDAFAILDVENAEVGHGIKLLPQFRWRSDPVVRRGCGQVDPAAKPVVPPIVLEVREVHLMDEDGVLTASLIAVAGPEIELIPRDDRGLIVNQWHAASVGSGFRQINRKFAHQAVMAGDDEHRLAFVQEA